MKSIKTLKLPLKDDSAYYQKHFRYAQQLAAIAASPGDRLLRVYAADYLEEEFQEFSRKRREDALARSAIWKRTINEDFRLGVLPIGPFRWDVFIFLKTADHDVEYLAMNYVSYTYKRLVPWAKMAAFPADCHVGTWTDTFQTRLVPSLDAAREAVPINVRAAAALWLLLADASGWTLYPELENWL